MMKKFIIERDAPGVGASSKDDFAKIAGTSNEVLQNLGPDIQWQESFVTDDKIYCVYLAKDEELIREHAKRGGFAADKISEVKSVLDPTTAKESSLPQRNQNKIEESRPH
jgi:hypothetical protein